MHEREKKISERGFTLVEVVISLSIISVLMLVMSIFVSEILKNYWRSHVISEVHYNTSALLSRVAKLIHSSQNIVSWNAQELQLLNPESDTITLRFDVATQSLLVQNNSELPVRLSSNEVEVSGFFSNLSDTYRSKNIGVHLEVRYIQPQGLDDYNFFMIIDSAFELAAR